MDRDVALGLAETVYIYAQETGLPLRLLGGVAVASMAPSTRYPPFMRDYSDLDYISYSRVAGDVKQILMQAGFAPDKEFNALHGNQRLLFIHPSLKIAVDVFLDEFVMSHRIDFRNRLPEGSMTIKAADLWLTKMQVKEINNKDLSDVSAMLADYMFSDEDLVTITKALSSQWGLYTTVINNIHRGLDWTEMNVDSDLKNRIMWQLRRIEQCIVSSPKSWRWRLRSYIGERLPWYELPEEINH